jgi:exodeoxyribonuclease VII small subunit
VAEAATPIEELSFEQALGELETIVRKLENGQSSLDVSINDYTRGTQLREYCEGKLKEASLRVEKIVTQADGSTSTESFEVEG